MKAAVRAGAAYFAIVFPCAVLLGTVRVLLIAPRLGEIGAVSVEVPLLLSLSWFAARWCASHWRVLRRPLDRLAMGGAGFGLLMSTETGIATFVLHRPLHDQVAALGSPAGALGLAAQVAFALGPIAALAVDGARTAP